MANLSKECVIPAGSQFTGTSETNGLFIFQSVSGIDIYRISFILGSESKDLTVEIVDKYDRDRGKPYENLAFANTRVDLVGLISLGPGERLKVTSASATSEMKAFILYKDLKG